jgi:two-component system phosphate regulon sensor histidine kinase PhoR
VAVFWYVLGILMGLALGLWRQRHWHRQKRQMLDLLTVSSWPEALKQADNLMQIHPQQQHQLRSLGTDLEKWERILQLAPIGYLQVDAENQLIWCNDEANQLLKMNQPLPGAVQRRRLLLEVARSYELDALIEEARQRQMSTEREWMVYGISTDPLHPKEEPTYPLRGHAIPLEQGEVGVFLVNRQEAARLVQQRDRWTSDVAHELKTPLTSIRLVAETLQPRIDPSLRSWLDRLINETLRLGNLVEDLLNLSRLQDEERYGLTLEPVDLPPFIQTVWQRLEPLAQLKQLSLHYQGPGACRANLDRTLFERVLINLLDNAIKHSPQQNQVYVKLSLPDDTLSDGNPPDAETARDDLSSPGLTLEVIDAGSGFAPRDLPHIFDRFYRADPARSRQGTGDGVPTEVGRGNGLGLAIVSQIVEAHGGSIRAANHPDLGGGQLVVTLPRQTWLDDS